MNLPLISGYNRIIHCNMLIDDLPHNHEDIMLSMLERKANHDSLTSECIKVRFETPTMLIYARYYK